MGSSVIWRPMNEGQGGRLRLFGENPLRGRLEKFAAGGW